MRVIKSHIVTGQSIKRIIPDIQSVLGISPRKTADESEPFDKNSGVPGYLWDLESGRVDGRRLHLPESDQAGEIDGCSHP